MPTLSAPLDSARGPLVRVHLLPLPRIGGGANRGPGSPLDGWALVDTGAKLSGIDKAMAMRFGLPQVGAAELRTPASLPENVPVFQGRFGFPGVPEAPFSRRLLGLRLGYAHAGLPVLILLGRDFLLDKRLVYDGTRGAFELSWKVAVSQQT